MDNGLFPTTGIGSLPHHNVDSALTYSFRHEIPFLPQLPLMNKKEFMIQQALAYLPGIEINDRNESVIDLKNWLKQKVHFENKLHNVFTQNDFLPFSIPHDLYSSWRPFLFECTEKKIKKIKWQIAGPLTCQIVSKLKDGDSIKDYPELLSQCFKSILVQAMMFMKEFKARDIESLVFIDEPALYTLDHLNPIQVTAFEDLRLMVIALKKEGAEVGIHCCANTNWKKVLGLPVDYISYDVHLSHENLFLNRAEIFSFIERGGGFGLGIIPTSFNSQIAPDLIVEKTLADLTVFFEGSKEHLKQFCEKAILTAACGLALKGAAEAEMIFSDLQGAKAKFVNSLLTY